MTSAEPTQAWLGCSIEHKPGRFFVQLVSAPYRFDGVVLASAEASTEEDAIAAALVKAGVKYLEGRATLKPKAVRPAATEPTPPPVPMDDAEEALRRIAAGW